MSVYHLPVKTFDRLPDTMFAGAPFPDVEKLREPYSEEALTSEFQFDGELVQRIVDKGLDIYEDKNELDGWLAVRLHNAIRAPRRLAGDKRFWAWVAVEFAQKYVQMRFSDAGGQVHRWRYTGELLRNAVARLWWGAEMVRDGPSYDLVPVVFARVRTAQFALELKYSWFRPAAMAFARVVEGHDGGARLTDAEMKALSRKVNAYLSLTALEGFGIGMEGEAYDQAWWSSNVTYESLVEGKIEGPNDGHVDAGAVEQLTKWFRELAA